MRVIAFAIIVSFLVTGYAAAANAFGLSPAVCPMKAMAESMDINDCPMHKKQKAPARDCDSCKSCCAVITALTPPALTLTAELPAATPDAGPAAELALNLLYPPFHPPDLRA